MTVFCKSVALDQRYRRHGNKYKLHIKYDLQLLRVHFDCLLSLRITRFVEFKQSYKKKIISVDVNLKVVYLSHYGFYGCDVSGTAWLMCGYMYTILDSKQMSDYLKSDRAEKHQSKEHS